MTRNNEPRRQHNPINSQCTETTEGPINHLEVYWDGGTFLAPVCITFTPNVHGWMRLPSPERVDGKLAYALPGGGRMVA